MQYFQLIILLFRIVTKATYNRKLLFRTNNFIQSSKFSAVKMKLPPLKGVLIHIIYWTLVAILTVISTSIGIIYIRASLVFNLQPRYLLLKIYSFYRLFQNKFSKAELLQLKLIHLFAREVLLVKKLEIEETKTTQHSTLETDIIKVGLVFSISNFFISKTSRANKWTRKKYLLAVIQLQCVQLFFQL